MDVSVSVSVGGRGVKVAVASGVELAGGTKMVAVSDAGMAVSVLDNATGAGLGPHAESASNKRIENTRLFISIVEVSVLEVVIAF